MLVRQLTLSLVGVRVVDKGTKVRMDWNPDNGALRLHSKDVRDLKLKVGNTFKREYMGNFVAYDEPPPNGYNCRSGITRIKDQAVQVYPDYNYENVIKRERIARKVMTDLTPVDPQLLTLAGIAIDRFFEDM